MLIEDLPRYIVEAEQDGVIAAGVYPERRRKLLLVPM
jgi:hypothetical protein